MNKLFNKKLYANTVGRLKLSGSIFLILCIILVFVPIINQIADARYTPGTARPVLLAFPLYGFMYLGSMVLTMSAFSYLNSRAASDFYHSLPNTRLCTLLSVLAGAFTWIVGTIVATCLLSALGYVCMGYQLNAGDLLAAVGYPLMVSLEIVGCTIIGMSLTGTFFSGIITTGLVAFLPRVLILFFQMAILSAAPILPASNFMGGFFDIANNLDVAVLSPVFYGSGGSSFMTNPWAYLYTGVLILLYFAAGAYLFVRRKSETAGKAAPGRITQAIYRCAITIPVLLIFYYLILYTSSGYYVGDRFTLLLVIMIGAALVYFVYEAIVTRKAKSLVRAIPLFVVLVAVTGVMAFAARNVGLGIMNVLPEEEEVSSIQLDGEGRTYSYTQYLTSQVKLTDPAVISAAVQSLEKSIPGSDANEKADGEYSSRVLRFNLKDGSTISRIVDIYAPEASKMSAAMAKNEEYLAAANAVPAQEDIASYSINDRQVNIGREDADAQKIFNAFMEDVRNSSAQGKAPASSYGWRGPTISFNVDIDGETYYQEYSINADTPLALREYMDYKESKDNLASQIDGFLKLMNQKMDLSISVTGVNISGGELNIDYFHISDSGMDYKYNDVYLPYDRSAEESETAAKIVEIVKNAIGREVSSEYQVADVGLYVSGGAQEVDGEISADFEPVNCNGVVLLTQAEFQQISDYCNALNG